MVYTVRSSKQAVLLQKIIPVARKAWLAGHWVQRVIASPVLF